MKKKVETLIVTGVLLLSMPLHAEDFAEEINQHKAAAKAALNGKDCARVIQEMKQVEDLLQRWIQSAQKALYQKWILDTSAGVKTAAQEACQVTLQKLEWNDGRRSAGLQPNQQIDPTSDFQLAVEKQVSQNSGPFMVESLGLGADIARANWEWLEVLKDLQPVEAQCKEFKKDLHEIKYAVQSVPFVKAAIEVGVVGSSLTIGPAAFCEAVDWIKAH